MIEILALCLKTRQAVTSDGDTLPVTDFIDRWGDPVDDEKDAFCVIAGPDREGVFWRMEVAEFAQGSIH